MAQSGQSRISQNATRAPAIPGATSQERDSFVQRANHRLETQETSRAVARLKGGSWSQCRLFGGCAAGQVACHVSLAFDMANPWIATYVR
jgi:3-mercaptopyruvate sulfurtransferase SseA